MQSVFIDISKYIFAGIIALYTLASYQGAIMRDEEKVRRVCTIQNILMNWGLRKESIFWVCVGLFLKRIFII